MLEIRVLRYFLVVAREQNMTRATSKESELCFKPLLPELKTNMYIIWKNIRYLVLFRKNCYMRCNMCL